MFLLAWSCALLAAAQQPERTPLLDPHVIPIAYDISLSPATTPRFGYGRGGNVDGSESIVIRVSRITNTLFLNSSHGSISSASIDGRAMQIASYPIAEQIGLYSSSKIGPGVHRLSLRFRGAILPDAHGLWPDSMDPRAPNLVTFFEPAMARSLFPCFDEPEFRASFTLHVVAPSDWTVISNMPARSTRLQNNGLTQTNFLPTPPIPTYLLTLDMGVFSRISSRVRNVPVSVYIRPGQEALASRVLATAKSSLAFYERDLGVAYPLPKLDIVVADGILNDAEQGYGVVTAYTEDDVGGKERAGILGQQDAFEVIAAPIAQHWFGGLVTQSWWSDAWVTYGLSGYETMRAERALRPDLAVIPNAIDWSWMNAYDRHSATTVRREITDDRNPAAWQGLNDRTFTVGAAMLDMWQAYIGSAAMHDAIRLFLSEHRNQAVSSDKFWQTFGGQGLAYGRAWLDQYGTPLLQATLFCHDGIQRVALEQQPIHAAYSAARANSLWPIPVSLRIAQHSDAILFRSATYVVPAGSCGTPVAINQGLRPPYLTRARGLEGGITPTDRLRTYADTQFLYNAHLASMIDLNAALAAYVPYERTQMFHLRYGILDLIEDAKRLRGSTEESKFDALVRSWAVPLEARTRDTSQPGVDASTYGFLLSLLSWMPTPALEAMAQTRYESLVVDNRNFGEQWGLAELAAQGATPARVAALLPVPTPPPFVDPSARIQYVLSIEGDATVSSVLASAAKRTNYRLYVTSLGARNPGFVSQYLDIHARELLRSVPPSQQAWTLTSAVVDGCWSARAAHAWREFFVRYLNKHDNGAIDDAVSQIAAKWQERRSLEAQLRKIH